jgi:hypothetical protein
MPRNEHFETPSLSSVVLQQRGSQTLALAPQGREGELTPSHLDAESNAVHEITPTGPRCKCGQRHRLEVYSTPDGTEGARQYFARCRCGRWMDGPFVSLCMAAARCCEACAVDAATTEVFAKFARLAVTVGWRPEGL